MKLIEMPPEPLIGTIEHVTRPGTSQSHGCLTLVINSSGGELPNVATEVPLRYVKKNLLI